MHAVTSLLSNFTDLCKPIKTYIYARKKHPFASYPAAKHPKHSKFVITDIREKPVSFFHCSTRAPTLVSAIILLTQVPLQKFRFLFIFIIPCSKSNKTRELSSLVRQLLIYLLPHNISEVVSKKRESPAVLL